MKTGLMVKAGPPTAGGQQAGGWAYIGPQSDPHLEVCTAQADGKGSEAPDGGQAVQVAGGGDRHEADTVYGNAAKEVSNEERGS